MLWVDVETTDTEITGSSELLEVGFAITEADLTVRAVATWTLQVRPRLVQMLRSQAPEVVQAMHDASGLWGAISAEAGASKPFVRDWWAGTGRDIGGWLSEHEAWDLPLCGSSVWFDRSWLAYRLPRVARRLHHRQIDVSSIKELLRRWRPAGVPAKPATLHRPVPDILDSIAELRHYRAVLGLGSP